MKVMFLPEVVDQFLDLAKVLYDKGYFSFRDSAVDYAESLFRSIQARLPIKLSRPAPKQYSFLGDNVEYALFRKSRRTVWYVFFERYTKENVLLVKYLSNNHKNDTA